MFIAELSEGPRHQLPPRVFLLRLLRQVPRQPPLLSGGRPALLRRRSVKTRLRSQASRLLKFLVLIYAQKA